MNTAEMLTRCMGKNHEREGTIQQAILTFFGAGKPVRLWRANTGVARAIDDDTRLIRFGVKGQADITGMVKATGRRLEIEVKASGKQSEAQGNFEAMIRRCGGLYILARSISDVIRELREAGVDV